MDKFQYIVYYTVDSHINSVDVLCFKGNTMFRDPIIC